MTNPFEYPNSTPGTEQIGNEIEGAHESVSQLKDEMEALHFKRMNVVILLNALSAKSITIKGKVGRTEAQQRIREALQTALNGYDSEFALTEEAHEQAKSAYEGVSAERTKLN